MSGNLVALLYLVAGVLFILAAVAIGVAAMWVSGTDAFTKP